MICLSSSRFSMRATRLLAQGVTTDIANPETTGNWTNSQDPYSGEFVEVYQKTVDDPTTPDVDEASIEFPCLARGVVSKGIRSPGNTETYGDLYADLEYVQIWYPTYIAVAKGDRLTDIKDSTGRIKYLDEEYRSAATSTVFNVEGVTPIFDAFNRHIENFALLSRAE